MPRLSRSLLLFAGSAIAVACGRSDSPSAPSDVAPVDVGAAISQMSSTSVSAIAGGRGMSGVPVGLVPPAVIPSACAYTPTVQGFVCPPNTAHGVTFSLSFFLADAAGHPQTQLDSKSTASIRTVVDAKGTLELPAAYGPVVGSVEIDDHNDMTMSGLLSTTRTLNGSGKSHYVITTTTPVTAHTVMDATSTTANVVIPASATDGNAWPRSGTITSDVKSVSQVQALPPASATLHTVLTFDGTSIVTMTTTVGPTTITCKIDLSGKTQPVCQ